MKDKEDTYEEYVKKRTSRLAASVTANELNTYIFRITNNEAQFPKAYRYTLSAKLRNTATDLCVTLQCASEIVPRYKRLMKDRLKLLANARTLLCAISALVNISYEVAHVGNREELARLLTKTGDYLNKWISTDKKHFKMLPTKKQFQQDMESRRELAKRVRLAKLKLDAYRNIDGFIELKQKEL